MIDITLGTFGRAGQFQKAIQHLNLQDNAEGLCLYIMDGNDDGEASKFLNSHTWRFASIDVFEDKDCISPKSKGRWPVIYNYLMKKGHSPYTTFWSDDIFPDKDCFKLGLEPFKDEKVGAVVFAWRDGNEKPYRIYGTEMHKQPMINFGLIRRSVLKEVNWIDERFSFYNADQDLSLKIWYKKYKVVRAEQCKVTHFPGKKSNNSNRSGDAYRKDSQLFSSKWSYSAVKQRKVQM